MAGLAKHVNWGGRSEGTVFTDANSKAARISDTFKGIRMGQRLQISGYTPLEAMYYESDFLTEYSALQLNRYITTDSLSCKEGREDLRMKLNKLNELRSTSPKIGKEIERLIDMAKSSGHFQQVEINGLIDKYSRKMVTSELRKAGNIAPKRLFN